MKTNTNEEKKIVTISPENRFHKARKKIAEISQRHNKDIGVAAVIWANATAQTDYATELKEFTTYVADKQKKTTKENNLVEKYFAGEDKA